MDWNNVAADAEEEFRRQGEACVEGTVTLALAADQRATTLCGIFGGGAVALLAATATLITSSHPNLPLLVAAGATAILLFAASVTCASAARPTDFYIGGIEPRLLIGSASDVAYMRRVIGEDLQMKIRENRNVLERSARLTTLAMKLATAAIVVGVDAFLIALAAGSRLS